MQGETWKDLYYRLSVINLNIPPLRERADDIEAIAKVILKKKSKEMGKKIEGFTKDALTKLKDYTYPGNVRELENIIMSAVSLSEEKAFLEADDIIINELKASDDKGYVDYDSQEETLDEFMYRTEKAIIEKVMTSKDNNISRTAEELGIKRQTLQHKLKKFGYNL